MPNPARPPTTRLIDSAVETAPRLQPKASTTTGKKTPKAARGMAMPQVTRKRPATISQRRADGRSKRLLTLGTEGTGALLDLERDQAVVRARHGRHDARRFHAATHVMRRDRPSRAPSCRTPRSASCPRDSPCGSRD